MANDTNIGALPTVLDEAALILESIIDSPSNLIFTLLQPLLRWQRPVPLTVYKSLLPSLGLLPSFIVTVVPYHD